MVKEEKPVFAGLHALPGFPLVLVTVNTNVMTAAAFSFYSFDPPSVMVGIRPETYTFKLLSTKREYGINIPTQDQLEVVQFCGSVSGEDEDKFVKARLTRFQGIVIKSVLVQECPVNLECKVVHEIAFGGSHRWFIGEIQAAHIDENYTRDQALMYWMQEYRKVGEVLLKVKRR